MGKAVGSVARRLRGGAQVAVTVAGFLILWEVAARGFGLPAYILPAPSAVFVELWNRRVQYSGAALFTLQPMLIGFAAAVIVGIALALIVAFSRGMEKTVYPLLVFFQIVPKIAVAPLFIIWFGFGLIPKVLLVFLLSFFPVVVSAITAFRSVDPDIMDLARSTGAGRWRIFLRVQVPHALPTLFTGIKVAAALSATAAVVAEFVASDRGLGYLLLEANGNLNTSMAFGSVFVLTALGFALYAAVELVEQILIPWHVSQRGHGDVNPI
ncbi:ABC transporter permease [Prosthecomicrobium hirschii]|uniref:ABC transporter permease n=1 Tax=Prosthecodimorpha hirschii TaxID=665126 RepID=A0A0P6VMY3_9HYPH|nr:ABC transporter permease [Prosthecomicrobium hirschii]KPL54156.1 ABC transporter permease [Prosthecomicrobium hirschii]MCW1841048.1 ABC transporter permease [Prosthecomicrobium hirschii]TPQ51449.1 ABC transporter permease [Prosthecomicrobium hirschii]